MHQSKRIICITEGRSTNESSRVRYNYAYKLPIKTFIYNNGGYLTIKQTQQLGFKSRIMGSTQKQGISFPNYKKIAD